jgi:hypothetical protein
MAIGFGFSDIELVYIPFLEDVGHIMAPLDAYWPPKPYTVAMCQQTTKNLAFCQSVTQTCVLVDGFSKKIATATAKMILISLFITEQVTLNSNF